MRRKQMRRRGRLFFWTWGVLLAVFSSDLTFAQSSSFSFSNLRSSLTMTNTPFGPSYIADDFAWSIASTNGGSVTVRSTLLQYNFGFTDLDRVNGGLYCPKA